VRATDKLALLSGEVGDTYEVVTGTTYRAALEAVLADAGVTGNGLLAGGDALEIETTEDMVWGLNDSAPYRWVDVANGLLSAIGYVGLYCDENGYYCSHAWADSTTETALWAFDATDPDTDIVDPERTLTIETGRDTRAAINWWRFVRTGLDYQPTDGDGLYEIDRSDGGARRKKTRHLYTDSQSALESEGDRIVQEDTQSARTLRLLTHPLPILAQAHLGVMTYTDPEVGPLRGQVSRYTIPLDAVGNRVDLTLEIL
jgi:hypothetical protein